MTTQDSLSTSTAHQIRALQPSASNTTSDPQAIHSVINELDERFGSWEELVALAEGEAEGGKTKLDAELAEWRKVEDESARQLAEIDAQLPSLIDTTQSRLRSLQSTAQSLSLDRYTLLEDLQALEIDLIGPSASPESDGGGGAPKDGGSDGMEEEGWTILQRLEELQRRLEGLQRGMRWIAVLERVMGLSQQVLHPPSTSSVVPPPLAALPAFRALHALVSDLLSTLPPSMALGAVVKGIEEGTWDELKRRLNLRLSTSLEAVGWPKKIEYTTTPLEARKAFERAFRELLAFQAEGEKLAAGSEWTGAAITSEGLYPFSVMVEPVAARFRFHFEGSRNTNRLDKPEWAFSHILDLLFEQRDFAEDYLQPLLQRSGFGEVEARSELVNALLPLPLTLLKHRFPHLLEHPALLAHTVYQSVVFDDALRDAGFDLGRTWKASRLGQAGLGPWRGITEEVLRSDGWYERWLDGEKKFADDQFNEIMASPDAGLILDSETSGSSGPNDAELRPTQAASQVKALIEQVTDRYSPLPDIEYKYSFLATIQIPLLEAYLSRFTSSLDAFETLSSAFMRAVPGALAGHASSSGLTLDQSKMTGGIGGLQRLCKAWVGLRSMLDAMKKWDDDAVFVTLAAEIEAKPQVRRPSDDFLFGPTVFSLLIERYQAATWRAEDMIVKQVTSEVEKDLRQHLTRKWDTPSPTDDLGISLDPALMLPLTTFTAQLGHVSRLIPGSTMIKLYRGIVAHISNHVMQRAVYAGWSKYTETGGQELLEDVKAWTDAAIMALSDSSSVKRPEVPWRSLKETAQVLSLPTEPGEDRSPSFSQAMALAFGDEPERLMEVLGLKELNVDTLQAVMRRRVECWR